jgi:opine dehydrogenase
MLRKRASGFRGIAGARRWGQINATYVGEVANMRIAIIGGGSGGKAAAADLSLAGHTVNLFEFAQFEENIKTAKERGGINLVGEGRNGFSKLNTITTNIEQALEGVDMILPVLTAFGHKPVTEACAAHLRDGQTIVLTPGSTLGTLEFHNALKKRGMTADIRLAEIHTLPYAARGSDKEVRILLEVKKLWLAAFPAIHTGEILERFRALYPVAEAQKNVLEVGLNNGNPVSHPTAALLNAGRVEYAKGEFYLYVEGITPHVADVMEAVDKERLCLCRKLGYREISTVERLFVTGYAVTRSSFYEAYHTSPAFCGKFPPKGPDTVMHRYYTEEVTYGLTTWSSLGKMIGVETPTIDALIVLISRLHKKDYQTQGERSMAALGISGMTADELNLFLETGEKPEQAGV